MRYLLLSVLVVCVIGVMVPSAFAQQTVQLAQQEFSQEEIDEMKQKIVIIIMHRGTFLIELFPEDAPNTVHNFLKLVESGYYDGIVFHRIIPGFMIQTGDPNTKDPDFDRSLWGRGGPGYNINEEFNALQHDRGIVSMARATDPDSAGSQFFIVHEDSNHLDGQYTIFGRLAPGSSNTWTLNHIASLETDDNDAPLNVLEATIITAKIHDPYTSADAKAEAEPESVAEPKTVTYATLPPGVKSPAPNFESEISTKYTHFDTKYGLTIGELYANWDYEWDSGFIKIVSGDGKDLLVWMLPISCDFQSSECSESVTFHIGDFYMYDGKDRKFEPVTSSTLNWSGSTVENTNFSWREDCSPLPVTVQPGIMDKMKICFEIPKNSDHFKLLDFYNLDGDVVLALLDRSTISNTASKGSQSGGGCLIATAAFGSEMAPQIQFLREIRDNTVLQTESGTSFMTSFNQFYYSFSPTIADYERENPAFKEAVKITLTPLLTSLTLLQYADIDSESEMLGYGIGVILLNIGMYFVAPAVLIMAVRKRV